MNKLEELAALHSVSVDFLQTQLTKGIQVEKEHTDSEEVAQKIALDHLKEDPIYYEKLQTIEKKNAKEMPKVYYCRHIQAGVAKYANEMLFIDNKALKEMMPTMGGVPVYVEHQDVDIEEIQEKADGYISECFYNTLDGWYWAKFIIVTDEGHAAIKKGYKVSNTYMPTRSGQGGEWHNIKYDREILEGYYTNLALVTNPRYEDACIMDADAFKRYNLELENQLKELKNEKEKEQKFSIIGGIKMKFFRVKKELIENADDITMQLENGKEMTLSEMKNAVEADMKEKEKSNGGSYSDDDEVEVGNEKMTIGELKNKYAGMVEKKNADEECKKKEEEEKKAEKEKEEAEEKKKDEEKKNGKHFDEMKKNIENGKEQKVVSTYETMDVKVNRGKERF